MNAMFPADHVSRRSLVTVTGALLLAGSVKPALAQTRRRATPSQTEGPYYPVEIWQCDEAGHYDHPRDGSRNDPAFQGFGRVLLNAAGEFRFRTIRPVAYTGRTPHIHAKIRLCNREILTTQLYVEGDPGNARDGICWYSGCSSPSEP